MDILVSSNLERLLYSICGSDTQVAGYMKDLSETGKYTVDGQIKASLAADFAAGFCDDTQTKAAIGEMFREKDYLMDTHTAVAYKVLCDYRAVMPRKCLPLWFPRRAPSSSATASFPHWERRPKPRH